MLRRLRVSGSCFAASVLFLVASGPAFPQGSLPVPRSRVVQAVDDAQLTTLSGNTSPLTVSANDQGPLDDATPLHRIVLVLQRSAQQETALKQLIDQQQDKSSSTYHQWLTPETFGAAFGPSDRDLSAITTWLSSHGFTGVQVNPGRTLIEFDGTAGAVRTAFHTTMHGYNVQGSQHFANSSDPQIPEALIPVIAGIASLNNFPRQANNHKIGNFRRDTTTGTTTRLPDNSGTSAQSALRPEIQSSTQTSSVHPDFTISSAISTYFGVTPYDFATIYNVLPLWNAAAPIDGAGQTIAIVGQTDINPADFVNFRKLFNLPLGNTATPTGTEYLNIIYNGPNPGIGADEGEADIDTQWSAAVAKRATIDYVVSEGTEVTQGTDLSAIYIVNNNLAPVMSYSYGACELFLGTAGNAFYNTLWQQAAAQGITVLLASGDSGAAGCDDSGSPFAIAGLAVNGLGSTPYNVAVGGTDFYMPNGGSPYWSYTNNSTTEASAKGYIPETTWNDSCANNIFTTTHVFSGLNPEQVCNSASAVPEGLITVGGGGGGVSSCTQSDGVTVGSCRGGYAKPAWQTGTGVPADSHRDVPDVSLFASPGFYSAFYVVCQQSANPDGKPCSLNAPAYDFAGYGGTSVAAPAFAGILSLVNQKTGSRQGNANYVLYSLASQQSKAGTPCNAASGAPSAGCVFNDITTDGISQPCLHGSPNCTVTNPTDVYGVLSGWSTNTGYDLATGLGSVNAANLVNNWNSSSFRSTSTTLTLSPSTITHGSAVAATVNVAATTGTPTGNVSINAAASNGSLQSGTLASGSYSTSLSNFPGGVYSVSAHYAGDTNYASSDSSSVTLTVNPEPSVTRLQLILNTPYYGTIGVSNGAVFPYGGFYLIRSDVAGVSGQGTATGNITLTDSGSPLDGGTFRLNSTSNTEDQTTALAPGTHVLTSAYSGDQSFNASQSTPFTITITKAPTNSIVTTDSTYVSSSATVTLTAEVDAQGFGPTGKAGYGLYAPGGTVTFSAGNTVLGTATLNPGTYPSAPSDAGHATFTFPSSQLVAGNNAITVTYSGDNNYSSSTSTSTNVTVAASTLTVSTTALTLSATSVAPGGYLTLYAAVTPASPQPTGTIQFTSDGQPVGLPVSLISGSASVTNQFSNVAPGSHTITAIYSGDSNYKSSVSAPVSFTITGPTVTSTTTIQVTPSPAVQGTTITVTSTITPSSPIPNGTAQLMLDGNMYGQPVPVVSAITTLPLTTSTLQPGSHIVQVLYSGDSTYLSSASAAAALTITAPAGTFTLSVSTSSATAALGQTSNGITLTATPVGGFNSTINFACTGAPAGSACVFTPASITPSGSAPASTTLTIAPPTPTQTSQNHAPGWLPIGTTATMAGLALIYVPRRSRRWSMLVVLLLFASLGLMTGCGSGGTPPGVGNAITGNYAITVTATGGSTTQTATINLTVQ